MLYSVHCTLYSSIQVRRLCAVTGSHERLMQKCEIQAKFCEIFVDQLFLQNMDHVEALYKKNCADNHLKKPVQIVLCTQQDMGFEPGPIPPPKSLAFRSSSTYRKQCQIVLCGIVDKISANRFQAFIAWQKNRKIKTSCSKARN